MAITIDQTDLKIIDLLRKDSKKSNREIAEQLKLPTTTIFNRIRRLEKAKIIQGYTIELDHKKLGQKISAYSLIHYDISIWDKETSREELRNQLKHLPHVVEIKYIIGQYDILIKFRIKDMKELNEVLLNQLRKIPGIGQTETFFVLEDVF
ncbi:MAG: Lrp/AsnC family transcriptional regulator [Pseudomonadota bacterium]